jgi:thiamine-phosphate pyrophosphorylase
MTFSLPKIYPITDVSITKLSHLKQVKQLIKGGAEIIQLREKTASSSDFYEAAQEVMIFARTRNVKIIINDRVDIALAVGADGIHLGQNDLPPAKARKILGANAIIGFSTHNIEQAIKAVKLPIDYLAIGPIFATDTKENPDPVVGIKGLSNVRKAIGDFPLVAIGGINFENAKSVFANGADSMAVVSAILNPSTDISENINNFIKHL